MNKKKLHKNQFHSGTHGSDLETENLSGPNHLSIRVPNLFFGIGLKSNNLPLIFFLKTSFTKGQN